MSGETGVRGGWVRYGVLFSAIALTAGGLAAWKVEAIRAADLAASTQPEPVELVSAAVARGSEYRQTTTSIGTVLALRSIRLRNEVAGTVRRAALIPGQVVEEGTVLVQLDASVEEAELHAQEAEAELAASTLERLERLRERGATSEEEVDQASSQRAVAVARMARTRAIIDRKSIRAPFRARVGIADVHPGQYLNEGTELTTLQGVDGGAHVDFAVGQEVAGGLRAGQRVEVVGDDGAPVGAVIVAIDARVDANTRNTLVRARVASGPHAHAPGGSVRVLVPVGPASAAVVVPVSAVRKGPGGDHVFVLIDDAAGATRAQVRPVTSGAMVGDEVVVLSGLAAGERVAATGSFKLREGVKVMLTDGQAAAAPSAAPAAEVAP